MGKISHAEPSTSVLHLSLILKCGNLMGVCVCVCVCFSFTVRRCCGLLESLRLNCVVPLKHQSICFRSRPLRILNALKDAPAWHLFPPCDCDHPRRTPAHVARGISPTSDRQKGELGMSKPRSLSFATTVGTTKGRRRCENEAASRPERAQAEERQRALEAVAPPQDRSLETDYESPPVICWSLDRVASADQRRRLPRRPLTPDVRVF
jgi:hypothetical protein